MLLKQSQGIIIVFKHFFKVNICKLSFFHLIIWVRFPYVHLTDQIFILNNHFCLFIFLWFLHYFNFLSILMVIISLELRRVNPWPKYIFNKCGINIYFFTLQWFGPSPSSSPNFKYCVTVVLLFQSFLVPIVYIVSFWMLLRTLEWTWFLSFIFCFCKLWTMLKILSIAPGIFRKCRACSNFKCKHVLRSLFTGTEFMPETKLSHSISVQPNAVHINYKFCWIK